MARTLQAIRAACDGSDAVITPRLLATAHCSLLRKKCRSAFRHRLFFCLRGSLCACSQRLGRCNHASPARDGALLTAPQKMPLCLSASPVFLPARFAVCLLATARTL